MEENTEKKSAVKVINGLLAQSYKDAWEAKEKESLLVGQHLYFHKSL